MTEVLHINEKFYVPISQVARTISYSRDHLTRLARDKKIHSVLIGRQWYIDESSLASYIESAELEQMIRKQQLSAARKEERAKHEKVAQATEQLVSVAEQFPHTKRATWWSSAVLVCGLGIGVVLFNQDLVPEHLTPLQNLVPPTVQLATVVASDQSVTTSFAYEVSAGVLPVMFTPTSEQDELPTNGVGVLLLPGVSPTAGETIAITDMFSDPVVVTQNKDGIRVVTAVDERGSPVNGGNNGVPFITVPITHVRE